MPHCHSVQHGHPFPSLSSVYVALLLSVWQGEGCKDRADRPVNPSVAEVSMPYTAVLSLTESSDTSAEEHCIHIYSCLLILASTCTHTLGQRANNHIDHSVGLVFILLGKKVRGA